MALDLQQRPLEQPVGDGQQNKVDKRHRQREVARIQHLGFRQQHGGGVDQRQQHIELDGKLDFLAAGAGDDVFRLVKTDERRHKGQHQQADGLHPIAGGVRDQLLQQPVRYQPGQQGAEQQHHKVR